jgi:UDP-4-amino-4,6-dideoxy-N-acetyl-beta-L-altrosamine N-acetyltransferase
MISTRDVTQDDFEKIRTWRNNPSVAKYMYTNHYISPEEHNRWFNRINTDPSMKYWIIISDGTDVGLIGLYNIDHVNKRASWAFYLAEESARGKGIGSYLEYFILNYSFEDLKLNKLCCEVLDINKSVVDMHKSFGFKEEGYFRQHILKSDGAHDVHMLAILAEEWALVKDSIRSRLNKKGVLL